MLKNVPALTIANYQQDKVKRKPINQSTNQPINPEASPLKRTLSKKPRRKKRLLNQLTIRGFPYGKQA